LTSAWRHRPNTFRALRATYGPLWVRCDFCRRFSTLRLTPEQMEMDYRKVHFSCSKCGGEAICCVVHPCKDGHADYKEVVQSNLRHPVAQERMRLRRGEWIPPKLRWKPMR
jgi:hypothetical protein